MRGGFRRRTWVWIATAAAAVVAATLIHALEPRTIWVRWDGRVATAADWAAAHLKAYQSTGGVTMIDTPRDPMFGGATSFRLAPGSVTLLQFVLKVSDMSVCADAPDGSPIPAADVAGLGLDAREVFLIEKPAWRRLALQFLPSQVPFPRTTRFVEAGRRTIDGIPWREFVAVPPRMGGIADTEPPADRPRPLN